LLAGLLACAGLCLLATLLASGAAEPLFARSLLPDRLVCLLTCSRQVGLEHISVEELPGGSSSTSASLVGSFSHLTTGALDEPLPWSLFTPLTNVTVLEVNCCSMFDVFDRWGQVRVAKEPGISQEWFLENDPAGFLVEVR
jgi:hypothetical protein